ncbi:LysM peptidoglycan-binding domain-containing protein [Streptomyces sp. OfavH-34-F]|uniref:LysM peptidoglycan-binding domain-containing protein n=1 Tax=Streptomyces sp. OfavH-34-F TaxID=2917760 RepID=UPI001EF1A5EC|nr:LysM peptidoglycan-binding domain-containing protein [Streptomyces sp. OfavH-34-F]MCG7522877.1 LysM peptidoglycan-binding domain-containing protein [Streptomyces sp. OfavH-34-F]
MTPTRPHTARHRPRAVDVVRGLVSLVVLLALLAGLPVLLWALTGVLLPDGVSPGEVTSLLTSHELGAPFFAVIMAIGWISWATFALCTLLEIPAQLRGRPTLRLPALGFQQRMAGALVSGVLILLPIGTAMAAPVSAAPAVTHAPTAATAPATVKAATASDTSAATARTADQYAGTYTVQARDSLSKIALKQLGDASRWREIATANDGKTMVDGTKFSTRSALRPGWKLTMPRDWNPANREHQVKPGETLSSIAETELGDASKYPQIAELNEGQRQPDGRTLSDPDKIYPGWELQLPHTAAPQQDTGGTAAPDSPAADQQDSHSADQEKDDGHAGQEAQHGQSDQDAGASTGAPSTDSGSERSSTPKANPTTGPRDTATPDATATPNRLEAARPQTPQPHTPAEDTSSDSSVASTAIAVTSLFAAAVLAVLGGRRALQQRRRRPRRRIPLPQQATVPADVEKQLRVASDTNGLGLVDLALRTLAANCAKTGQPLPQLDAIRVTPRGLELHLSAPTPEIAPFSEMEENPDRWWCPARGAHLLDAEQARDITPPYPALVSLGETEEQEPVLVNLESVGALRLSGADADIRAVMLGMAVELASSGLSDDATVILAGLGEELVGVFPIRVEHQRDLAHALPELRAHDALQRGALAAGGLDSLDQARLVEDGGDTWVPKVLITPAGPAGEEADALTDLLCSRPRTATAVVTEAEGELEVPGAWTLPAAPGTAVQLPGLDLTVTLQRLEDEAYDPLIQLLATAARTDDVAAPAWTHSPYGTAVQNGPAPVTPQGDSALAQATPEVAPVEDGLPEEDGTQQTGEPQAAPAVQVAVSPVSSSFITAVPSFSALAPSVTGAEDGFFDGNGPEQQHGGSDDDEIGTAREPRSEDLFDETLQEVLDERDAPEEDAGEYEQGEDPVDEAAGFDELTAEQPEEEGSALSPATLGSSPNPQLAPPPAPVERPAARVTAVTSGVLAALNTPPDPPSAPQIRVLGPVDVISTLGKVESNRRNGLTEIAAWLALHPGKSRHELDEAIWPGQRVRADTRNTNISKLRAWLGRDPLLPAEDPCGAYLPPISEGVYAFNHQVTSDWQQFQAYYQEGMHSSNADADTALANALSLVRGRPFSDIDQSKYAWAEYDIQEMISATTDVAHELATRRLAVRDYRAALAAASRGLVCDQMSELLYRDLFTIYSETGDRQGLERTAHQLTRIAVESGCDSAPETVALINALMDANRIASA